MSNLYDVLIQAGHAYKRTYEVCLDFEKDISMKFKYKEVQIISTGQSGTIQDIMLFGDGTVSMNVLIDGISFYIDNIKDIKLL